MKYNIFTIIFILILTSCSSTKKTTERRCQSTLKNDYKNILVEKTESIVNGDTIFLNEVKFECVLSAMYIQKGMYDRFGKWDMAIYPEEKHFPILLWNNVKLFQNDTTEFTVAANGIESKKTIYSSAFALNKQNKDLLSNDSEYKTKLIAYFSEMIKTNDSNKKDFYEIYWKTVNPKYWEQIKRWHQKK